MLCIQKNPQPILKWSAEIEEPIPLRRYRDIYLHFQKNLTVFSSGLKMTREIIVNFQYYP